MTNIHVYINCNLLTSCGHKRNSVTSEGSRTPCFRHLTVEIIDRALSVECRKTKTKVITTANQKKDKYHKEPIRTQSKYR